MCLCLCLDRGALVQIVSWLFLRQSHAVVCFFMGCGKVWKARQREDLRRQRNGSWWCLDDDVGWSDFRLLGSGFELPDSRYWMVLEVMGLVRVCRGSV